MNEALSIVLCLVLFIVVCAYLLMQSVVLFVIDFDNILISILLLLLSLSSGESIPHLFHNFHTISFHSFIPTIMYQSY